MLHTVQCCMLVNQDQTMFYSWLYYQYILYSLFIQFGYNVFRGPFPQRFKTQYRCYSVSMLSVPREDVDNGGKSKCQYSFVFFTERLCFLSFTGFAWVLESLESTWIWCDYIFWRSSKCLNICLKWPGRWKSAWNSPLIFLLHTNWSHSWRKKENVKVQI